LLLGGTVERPQDRRERAKQRHVTTRPHVFMSVHHLCHSAPGRAVPGYRGSLLGISQLICDGPRMGHANGKQLLPVVPCSPLLQTAVRHAIFNLYSSECQSLLIGRTARDWLVIRKCTFTIQILNGRVTIDRSKPETGVLRSAYRMLAVILPGIIFLMVITVSDV